MIWYFIFSLPHNCGSFLIIWFHFFLSHSTCWEEFFVFNHWTLFSLIFFFHFVSSWLWILLNWSVFFIYRSIFIDFYFSSQISVRLNIFLICNLRMKRREKKNLEPTQNKYKKIKCRRHWINESKKKLLNSVRFFLLFRLFCAVICGVFCLASEKKIVIQCYKDVWNAEKLRPNETQRRRKRE